MATSLTQNFSKEEFKKNVISNCKSLYRKNIEEANQQEVFQAVSYAVKDIIIDKWIATHKQYEKDDPKIVYYMSMEFLMGRALGNNMINLCAYDEIKEALDELGLDINVIEDQEPDAALGNGGLGRLAACFMDSLATLEYPAYGCGIRYKYGMFKQQIVKFSVDRDSMKQAAKRPRPPLPRAASGSWSSTTLISSPIS